MRQQQRYPRKEGSPHRYTANANLRDAVTRTGRRLNWIAAQLGVSRSHLSHILAGRRTISEADARVLVALIGGEFSVLFELSDDGISLSLRSRDLVGVE